MQFNNKKNTQQNLFFSFKLFSQLLTISFHSLLFLTLVKPDLYETDIGTTPGYIYLVFRMFTVIFTIRVRYFATNQTKIQEK